MTGVFPVNYGGATESRLGITMKQMKSMLDMKRLLTRKTGRRTMTYSIHGSHLLYGRSRQWAGLTLTAQSSKSITPQMHL